LYPRDNGLWHAIGDRIELFLEQRMGFSPEKADSVRADYLLRYGTTLRGLALHDGVEPEEYLEFVHDIRLEDYLQADARLRDMLADLPLQRMIFSNAHRPYILAVLRALGIESQIHGIVDIMALDLFNKPLPEAYRRALQLAGNPAAHECTMVDDLSRNLDPAAKLGMRTILVGPDGGETHPHLRITRIHDLAAALRPDSGG
jgi:putative hydrolase of the HAD superfamily